MASNIKPITNTVIDPLNSNPLGLKNDVIPQIIKINPTKATIISAANAWLTLNGGLELVVGIIESFTVLAGILGSFAVIALTSMGNVSE